MYEIVLGCGIVCMGWAFADPMGRLARNTRIAFNQTEVGPWRIGLLALGFFAIAAANQFFGKEPPSGIALIVTLVCFALGLVALLGVYVLLRDRKEERRIQLADLQDG